MKRIHVPTLVIGIVCLIVGSLGMVTSIDGISLNVTRNFFAGALVVAGSIGLIVALRYRREDHN